MHRQDNHIAHALYATLRDKGEILMRIIIDRFEGDYAIVELPDRSTVNVPKTLFTEAAEGDSYVISKDKNQAERLNNIQSKFDRLKK